MPLVRRFLCGMMVVAAGWFIIVFFYLENLTRNLFALPHPVTTAPYKATLTPFNMATHISTHMATHRPLKQSEYNFPEIMQDPKIHPSGFDLSPPLKPPGRRKQRTKHPFSIKHRFRRERFNVSNVFIYKRYTIAPPTNQTADRHVTKDGGLHVTKDGGGHVTKDGGGHVTTKHDNGHVITKDGGGNLIIDGGGHMTEDGGGHVIKDGGGRMIQDGGGHVINDGGGHMAEKMGYLDLTADEKEDIARGEERHSYNVSASYRVPVNRTVPDFRPDKCPRRYDLPPVRVSVIICFHNEAWSTLMRTLWSVLNTAPPAMLHQVILVDDASTYDYLGAKLAHAIASLAQVELHRTGKREGLVRSRLLGVSKARGDILVFLDAHCECAPQWLEPLVQAIVQDRKQIVCPEIDIISAESFAYEPAPGEVHGGFQWDLQFVWKPLPPSLSSRRPTDPIRSPTMVGGLFAVDKDYFLRLGTYDPQLEIWGGENLELSFRVWSCGGRITILPCSRVGHVFRRTIPYTFPSGARATLRHNALIVADTWLGEYRKYYYAATAQSPSESRHVNVTSRHDLLHSLHCHDFAWYLRNVVPEMPVPSPNALYFGQVQHGSQCLTAGEGGMLLLSQCITQQHDQTFTITTSGQLTTSANVSTSGEITSGNLNSSGEMCVGQQMKLTTCEKAGTGRWQVTQYHQLQYRDADSTLCLGAGRFAMVACSATESEDQTWRISHHFHRDIMAQFPASRV